MSDRSRVTALVERIQSGEKDLMAELWEAVKNLVAWYANRVIRRLPTAAGLTFDDLYNSGYIALADAVERHDTNRDGFISLFMFCLKTAFAEAAGARSGTDPLRQVQTQSLDEPIPGTDDLTLCDTIADTRDNYEDADRQIYNEQLHAALELSLSDIDQAEADIIRRRYYNHETLKDIAEEQGISTGYVQQLEKRGLRIIHRKHGKRLREYTDEEVYSAGIYGNGVATFNRVGSGTERAAIRMFEGERKL